jgi:cyclopropane-fatty-acyl-phospholipid synthase
MLTNKIIETVEQKLYQQQIPLAVKFWNEKTVTGAEPVRATVELPSASSLMLFTSPTLSKLAESYVEEKIHLQGRIRDVLNLLAPLVDLPDGVKRGTSIKWKLWKHTRASDRKAISSHYDVSNDFYALWLDRRRVYSCAYFRRPEDTLDIAQEQKLDHICRKLMLQKGERFLDIGCGWGGLILWAAQNYSVHSVGITISQNQYDYVREHAKTLGIADRIDVRLMDYRDLPDTEPFDKIASVGMFEHVGIANLPIYFRKIHQLLKPGGRHHLHHLRRRSDGRRQPRIYREVRFPRRRTHPRFARHRGYG